MKKRWALGSAAAGSCDCLVGRGADPRGKPALCHAGGDVQGHSERGRLGLQVSRLRSNAHQLALASVLRADRAVTATILKDQK